MKKLLTIGVVVCLLVAVLAFVGGSLLGTALKAGIESIGSDMTDAVVELDSSHVSLFTGRGEFRGLQVGNPEGFESEYAFRVGYFAIDVKPTSLLSDKIVIEELLLDDAECIYEANLSGSNFSRILQSLDENLGDSSSGSPEGKGSGDKLLLEVKRLRISGTKVTLASALAGAEEVTLHLPPIEIDDIGSGPEGVTIGEVARRALASINRETIVELGKSGEDVGRQLQGAAKEAQKKLGGILKGLSKEGSDQ